MLGRDDHYMWAAIEEAQKAALVGEVPIGAVIVYEGEIIGRGHNLREHSQNALLHAEMVAIEEANAVLHSWRLTGCQLYVTLEPCVMCSGAIVNARLDRVVFGARDPKAGGTKTLYEILSDNRLNHQVDVTEGVLADEASQLLKTFFRAARNRRKAAKKIAQDSN
ncbi:tRNA-specific adenosine deaminase [Secundilactobacillus kimchicus]|nr:tRNA adenosine(34) deaminase TadA [Secundilactobacillus kimchicus]MBT9671004.1 tRNA-specific adenosine deaminase [Secundilactobacillus kimchicus]